MLYDVVEAEARPGFKVWVRFEDGLEGVVVISHRVGKGGFKRWADKPAEFSEVAVDAESGTLVWPGGLDVAPDTLYRDVAGLSSKLGKKSKV